MLPYLLILVPGTAWTAVNVLLGVVVARNLFAYAPAPMAPVGDGQISRMLAGAIFGDCLTAWYGLPLTVLAGLVCLGLGLWAGRLWAGRRRLTGATLVAAFVALSLLHAESARTVGQVGQMAAALGATPAVKDRVAFQTQHHRSEQLVKLETAVVAALTIAALIAAARRLPVADAGKDQSCPA